MDKKFIKSAHVEDFEGMKVVLANGDYLESQIKRARELNYELSLVNKNIANFSPVWQLVSLKEE